MNLSPIYIEISHNALKALRDERGLELPLERTENGRLTGDCKQKLITALQNLVHRKAWHPRVRAFCAIAANGVSLRRLTLPPAGKTALPRLLQLQIESEFPLSPGQLAWGYRSLDQLPANGSPARQDFLVAAVKKEVIADYSSVLEACGLNPAFTLAALSRSVLCPKPLASCAVLDIGPHHSEIIAFENGVPGTLRILPWGSETAARSASADNALEALAQSIAGSWTGSQLYICGLSENLAPQLERRLGPATRCDQLKTTAGEGRSAAIAGLRKSVEERNGSSPLLLEANIEPAANAFGMSHPLSKKLLVAGSLLLISLILLPYAEALLLKNTLSKKLESLDQDRGRLEIIDRELGFLQYLKDTQPPYLDALYLFSKSAPQGMKVESLSMNRRGEVAMRGSMRDGNQVADFRSKLIASGFFSNVTVEEQAPTPDRQKVNVRLSALWIGPADRARLAIGPTPEEIEKAKTATNAPAGGRPMPGGMPVVMPGGMRPGMPPGMPPGMVMPTPSSN